MGGMGDLEFWDDWRGSLDGRPAMYIKRLASAFSCIASLHKFVRPDDLSCYHTHPAYAVRVVLRGGYVEEMEDGTCRARWPGYIGIVSPSLSHRVTRLINGPSYSLWLRGPKCAEVQLNGKGWDMNLPDIEVVSACVHATWMESKRAQGVESRKAEDGEELMVPYDQLSEKAKQLDRGTVQAVYSAIAAASPA